MSPIVLRINRLHLSNLRVRLVTQPDPKLIKQAAELEKEAFGRGGLNEWHLPVLARHGRLFVIEDENEGVIASAALIKDWADDGAFLFDLAVAERLRGSGKGKMLMGRLIETLKEEGLKYIELTVAPSNRPAIKLYESLGFRTTAEYKNEYGPGEDRVLMRLELCT